MNLDRYSQLYRYLETDITPEDFTERQRQQLINQARHFETKNNLLYKKNRKDLNKPLWVIK